MIFPAMDTIFNVFLNKEADGSIQEVMSSTNNETLQIPMSGRHLRADPNDANKTWVTIVHEINFGENVVPAEVSRLYYK